MFVNRQLTIKTESFFGSLEKERISRQIYATRELAKQGIFEYMGIFYKPKCRHRFNGQLHLVDYEKHYIVQG